MFEWATGLMERGGYAAIALLMILENVFPPLPSELIMPFAGFAAARGELSLWGVVVAGTVGSVVGQMPIYYLGRCVGKERLRQWADKHGAWLTVSGEEIERSSQWFEKHGSAAVLYCRLVPGIRSLISIPAGIAGMPMVPFLVYSTIGKAAWTGLLAYLGFRLGENYEAVKTYLGPATYVVLGGLLLYFLWWIAKRKKEGATPPAEGGEEAEAA